MQVGLTLGGGGARGFAHIGVLRAMNERGIEPVAISGCSMGGIVGATVANGWGPDDIRKAFADLKPSRLFDWGKRGAIFGGEGIVKVLKELVPRSFADLKLPLRVTAVDVQQGRLVVLREGELIPALRATCALPGIFSPEEIDGRVLVDGGLLNNVPIDEVQSMTDAATLAVDVSVPPDRRLPFDDPRSFWEKIKDPIQPGKRALFVELLIKAYDIPSSVLTSIQIASLRPHILIRPLLDPDLKVEDFDRMDEAIEAGYKEAVRVLDAHPLLRS